MKNFLTLTSTLVALALYSNFANADGKTTINICTGGEGKPYNLTGNMIASFIQGSRLIDVKVITTNGSGDNIARTVQTPINDLTVASGEACQVMIGQPDTVVRLKIKDPAAAMRLKNIGDGPAEYLHVLCSKESGITDLKQVQGQSKYSIAIGPEGSGAWDIWHNFIDKNKAYADVQVAADEGIIALGAVSSNDTSCMLVPAGLKNAITMIADNDFGDKLNLVGADDRHFDDATDADGKKLYTWQNIPSGTYAHSLQTGFFGSKVSTVAWTAKIYVNSDFFRTHQKELAEIILAAAKAKPTIKNQFGSFN